MKLLFVSMILAALANSALGQSQTEVPKCSLTAAQSPTIRGLKLGMGVEEVLKQFPGSSEETRIRHELSWAEKQEGLAKFNVTTHPDEAGSRFEGIYQFGFEFLDNRLSGFEIHYKGPEWKNADEFISKLSETLSLPAASYWTPANIPTVKTLKCEGFEVRIFLGGPDSNSLMVRNPAVEQIVANRKTEAKERARKEFKP